MLPVTPSIIPEPFAEHGAKNVIPAESPGASEPNASWTQGFPPVTMLNKQAGGKPPLGQDFNGILNALSQHLFFTQSGCVYPWVGADEASGFRGLNYLGGSHVLGPDLKEYIAVHPSGPDVPQEGGGYVGPQDPVTDTEHVYWRPEVTTDDIPEFDNVTIKEINGKYGVPEFTAPTTSAPGKAGLVPGQEIGRNGSYLRGDGAWADIPDGTLTQKGLVQLYNGVDNPNAALAATAAAVKAAYDRASQSGAYAPIPTGAAGPGQWVSLLKWNITELYLPQGGVWAWYFWSTIPRTSDIQGSWCGVGAGGSRIGFNTNAFSSFGFAWRIA